VRRSIINPSPTNGTPTKHQSKPHPTVPFAVPVPCTYGSVPGFPYPGLAEGNETNLSFANPSASLILINVLLPHMNGKERGWGNRIPNQSIDYSSTPESTERERDRPSPLPSREPNEIPTGEPRTRTRRRHLHPRTSVEPDPGPWSLRRWTRSRQEKGTDRKRKIWNDAGKSSVPKQLCITAPAIREGEIYGW
jgi:hypothetical protein